MRLRRSRLAGVLVIAVTHDVPSTPHRHTLQVAPNATVVKPGELLVEWVAIYKKT